MLIIVMLIKKISAVQKRLDRLLLTVKGGHAMMIFRHMHLDTGKRWICTL